MNRWEEKQLVFGCKAGKGVTKGEWEEPRERGPGPLGWSYPCPSLHTSLPESSRSTCPLVYWQWQLWGLMVQLHIQTMFAVPNITDSASKARPKLQPLSRWNFQITKRPWLVYRPLWEFECYGLNAMVLFSPKVYIYKNLALSFRVSWTSLPRS